MADTELNNVSPLAVRCTNCGAETVYDPARHNYHCLYCGSVTETDEARQQLLSWEEGEQRRIRDRLWASPAAIYRCPVCSSTVLLQKAEHFTCVFCSSAMERRALSRSLPVPPLLLPFSLSREQAVEKLKAWAEHSRSKKEAKRVLSHLDRLEAYYLPVQLLSGPVGFQISRDNSANTYFCRGQLDAVTVNASYQLDDLMLAAVEPFDWSRARETRLEDFAQARIKLRDVSDKTLRRRADEQVALSCQAEAERALHISELKLSPDTDDCLQLPALAPVFLLNVNGAQVIINGQSGRIAVCRDEPKRSRLWLLEPLILSLLAAWIWLYVAPGNLELFVLATLASTILIFALLGGQRGERLHRRIFRIRDARAEKLGERFLLSEDTDIFPSPLKEELHFYLPREDGDLSFTPKHLTSLRLCLLIFSSLLVLLLPYLLACLIAAFGGGNVRPSEIQLGLGAAWYVAAAVGLLMLWQSLGKSLLFDHLILQRTPPGASPGSVLKPDATTEARSLWTRIRYLISPDALAGLCLGLLALLLISILAMLA